MGNLDPDITVQFGGEELRFDTDEPLFSPKQLDLGSRFLLETVVIPEWARTILDLGCGWGGMGITLAKLHPEKFVYFLDSSPKAVEITKRNLALNEIGNAKVLKADVTYQTLPQRFDLILCNPPWSKNKSVMPNLIKFAWNHLAMGGEFWMVVNEKFKTDNLVASVFGSCEIKAKSSPYKILSARKS